MKSMSAGRSAPGRRKPQPNRARLFALGALPVVLAMAIAGFALLRTAGEARGQDCPPGTLPFHLQFGVPPGSFDLGDLPGDLPSDINLQIRVEPSSSGGFDLILVTACLSPDEVPPGSLPGTTLSFTTPTPGVPVRFSTPTNTPPPSATALPTTAPAAATGATVSGIRPPSTGDAGLASAGNARPAPGDLKVAATFALFVLGGGLAIGASLLGGISRPRLESRGMGASTPAGAGTDGRSPSTLRQAQGRGPVD